MPALSKSIPKQSELHAKLCKMLDSRLKLALKGQQMKHNAWQRSEDTMLAYVPESDLDSARKQKRDSGQPKYTTIKLPYTYALVLAAHTYLTSVFFGRSPVHQFSGRHGEGEQQIQALEALIGYQVEVGKMMGPYYLWFFDALKYSVGVIEEFWEDEIVQFSTIQEGPNQTDPLGPPEKLQVRVQMPGYQGSKINNISPWDFLPDPRVQVGNYQKGEFVFVRKYLGWNTIVRRKAQGYYMNVEHLRGEVKDFAGVAQGSQLQKPENSSFLHEGDDQQHPAVVTAYEGCIELIPSEWGLGNNDYPEKWVFTITGDLETIIGCQPHGAMHCEFPYGVIESEVEAYGTWNRGMPEIIEPIQNTLDWLINQHFFNVRASLNNQFIIDPSKIVTSDAKNAGPGFLWRLRPEAYGQDIRSFFHQVPVTDVTRSHIGDMQTMYGVGERVFGINDQILGMMAGQGRKTATEVRTSTGFGVSRQKTVAEYISATGFASHAQRMVQMSQQYFTAERKFKIAGPIVKDMTQKEQMNFIDVSPASIKGFFDVVPVDGTLPVDRLALATLWKSILLEMRAVPGLIGQFDLGRIFAHVAQLAGIRNLNQFKIEIGSPQSLLQQADAGNIVPLGGGGRRAPTSGSNPPGIPTAGPPVV
jgi:hypothetical protein